MSEAEQFSSIAHLDGLRSLGFDEVRLASVDAALVQRYEIARVVAVHKERYLVSQGQGDMSAELAGKSVYAAGSPLDYPTVGDWVWCALHDERSFAVVHGVLSRRTLLKRKTPGKQVDFQLIGANIDVALIVQSLDENFNLRRLERYLVMIHEGGIRPIILLSKSDLLEPEEIAVRIGEIELILPDIPVRPFSSETEAGLQVVRQLLEAGKTYCLLGSSGVGKTTLLNHLLGEGRFETQAVREKDSRGRHTTTHRQLTLLAGGAMVVDTPGMRELGSLAIEAGVDETFAEIAELAQRCRFNDCTHRVEKGCAVLEAREEGRLSEARYQNYLKMQKEAAHHEMSYQEKRRRSRQQGRFYKSVLKAKKNRH